MTNSFPTRRSSDLAAMPEVERVIGNREKFDSASFAANNRGFPKNAAPSPGPFTDNNAGGWFSGMDAKVQVRSEEHTSELQSLMRISYAVFCLKKIHFIFLILSLFFLFITFS